MITRCRYTHWFLLLTLIITSACGSGPSEHEKLLTDAKDAFSRGAFVEARTQLEQYLSGAPGNAGVFLMLGEIAEKQANASLALQHYGQVIHLDNGSVEARLRAAKLFLAGNNVQEATHVLRYVKDFRPNDTRLLSLEAAIAERSGDLASAIDSAKRLMSAEPSSTDPVLLLADLYAKTSDFSEAEKVLRQSLVNNPNNTTLLFSLANNLISQGQPRDGETLLRDLLIKEPGVFPYQLRLAELYGGENRLDEAEDLLRRAVRDDLSDERRVLVLAGFLAEKRTRFIAEEELVNGLFNRPKSISIRIALAELYEKMLNLDGAAKLYKEIADIAQVGTMANIGRIRAAAVFMNLGERAEAEALAVKALQDEPDNLDAMLLRGRLAMLRGDSTAAIEDFRKVLTQRPQSFDTLAWLIRAYVQDGQAALAEQGLRRSIEVDPKHEGVRVELVQLLAADKRMAEALAETDKALAVFPNSLLILQRRVELFIAQEKWDQAEEQAKQIQTLYPDLVTGFILLGRIYYTQSRFDKAEEAYKVAVVRAPLQYEAIDALAQTMLSKDGLAAAVKYLEQFLQTYSNHPTAYNVLGGLYVQQNSHTKAEAAFARAYQLNPTWIEPYKNLAKLYQSRGELEAAIQVFLNGLAIVPDSMQLAFLLATTYEHTDKPDDAIDAYEGILINRPRMDVAASNLAMLLVNERGGADSLKRARELAQRFEGSQSPQFLDTLAWTLFHSGEAARAQQILEQIVAQHGVLPLPHYHLGVVYNALGERDKARAQLHMAVDARLEFPGYGKAQQLLQELENQSKP